MKWGPYRYLPMFNHWSNESKQENEVEVKSFSNIFLYLFAQFSPLMSLSIIIQSNVLLAELYDFHCHSSLSSLIAFNRLFVFTLFSWLSSLSSPRTIILIVSESWDCFNACDPSPQPSPPKS